MRLRGGIGALLLAAASWLQAADVAELTGDWVLDLAQVDELAARMAADAGGISERERQMLEQGLREMLAAEGRVAITCAASQSGGMTLTLSHGPMAGKPQPVRVVRAGDEGLVLEDATGKRVEAAIDGQGRLVLQGEALGTPGPIVFVRKTVEKTP